MVRPADLTPPNLTLPYLRDGERYAGVLISRTEAPSHHVILLPAMQDDVDWTEAKYHATTAGGDLPSWREMALLMANLRHRFALNRCYWALEEHEHIEGAYFTHDFTDGVRDYQLDWTRSRMSACAVRRVPFEARPSVEPEVLQRLIAALEREGARLPVPAIGSSVDSAYASGLSSALGLVEAEMARWRIDAGTAAAMAMMTEPERQEWIARRDRMRAMANGGAQ
jgi:hypothetical protein